MLGMDCRLGDWSEELVGGLVMSRQPLTSKFIFYGALV
jgi:hypothetical protein